MLETARLAAQTLADDRNPAPMQGVSIILPAYDEEDGIGPVLEQLHAVMARAGLVYEIVVVDDGSRTPPPP